MSKTTVSPLRAGCCLVVREAKIQHVFYESPGTDHEWQTWRRDLKDFAPRLFNN